MKKLKTVTLCLITGLIGAALLTWPLQAQSQDPLTLGGDSQVDPLKITAHSDGNLTLQLWQPQQGFGTPKAYVSQYKQVQPLGSDDVFDQWGSQLRWQREDGREQLIATPYYAGSGFDPPQLHRLDFPEMSDAAIHDQKLTQTWQLSDPKLQLTRHVHYESGDWFFTLRYEIQNQSEETLSQLYFLHGGDSDLYGDEAAKATWDEAAKRLILWPQQPWDQGLFLYQALTAPSSHYGGSYAPLREQALTAKLPGIKDEGYIDRGLQMLWQRDFLDPGETLVIESRQKLTPSGSLQVLSPDDVKAKAGETVVLMFEIFYAGETISDYDLVTDIESYLGWDWQLDASPPRVLPGQDQGLTQTLTLSATVPDSMASERVTLSLHEAQNPYFAPQSEVAVEVAAITPTPQITASSEPTTQPTTTSEWTTEPTSPPPTWASETTIKDTIATTTVGFSPTENLAPRQTEAIPATGWLNRFVTRSHPASILLLVLGGLAFALTFLLHKRQKRR